MRTLLRALSLLTAACLAGSVAAQSAPAAPSADQLQHANARFASADWAATLAAYSALSEAFPSHALSRFRMGVAQLGLGRLDDAERNLREGERLGVPAAQGAFRLAQLRAEQGRGDAAMDELFRAARARLVLALSTLEADPHLAKVKSHPRWRAALDAIDAVSRPCMHDARHREFDFWLGDWDVRPIGQPAVGPAARNTVTLENNGCVVMEHWVAPSGSEGQSFNLFDRSVGKWRQTWVDNVGGQHDYRGSLQDGNMVYEGDTPAANGQLGRVPTRLTFFRLGADSVRQFSQSSPDSGRTWVTAYDLMYVRRRSP